MLMLVLLLLLVLILTPTFASYLAILLELVLLGCIRWRCFRIVNNQRIHQKLLTWFVEVELGGPIR